MQPSELIKGNQYIVLDDYWEQTIATYESRTVGDTVNGRCYFFAKVESPNENSRILVPIFEFSERVFELPETPN